MPTKIRVARLVVVPLFIPFMHCAVTLNRKSCFSTKEVNYVVT